MVWCLTATARRAAARRAFRATAAASAPASPLAPPALPAPPRWRRRAAAAGGIGAAAAAAAAVSAHLEPGPDEEALPRRYDAEELAAYWRARPWAVRRRCLEVACELLPLAAGILLDWRSGALAPGEPACQQRAAQAREALVRLGPAFIKVGQALSIRPDLLPAAALKELQRLCDDCPPFSWRQARRVLAEELGAEPSELFLGLGGGEEEPKPVAAASLGQVYRWRLRESGRAVAVKVQRPDMMYAVSLDVHILRGLARLLRSAVQLATKNRTDHVALLDAWARGTIAELDYEAEARNQERFRAELGRLFPGRVYVPSVEWSLTRRHVLVSEWIDGPRLSDCAPEVVKALSPTGVECFLAQLLEIGLFHSDPHPGNLLVSEGRLVLLDFGLVAEIEDLNLHRHATAIVNLINGDCEALLEDFVALGFLPQDVDRQQVLPPLRRVLEQGMLSGSDLKRRKKNFQAISDDLNDIFFDMPFSVPEYFALITRALATLEGIALLGDSEFDIFWASYPYALGKVTAILGPRRTSGLLSAAAARAVQQLPAPERGRRWAAAAAEPAPLPGVAAAAAAA